MERVAIYIKANPGSGEFSIEEKNKWTGRIKVNLSEPPKKNMANKELLSRFSEILNADVSLKRGAKSNKKVLLVKGLTKEEVGERLEKHEGNC